MEKTTKTNRLSRLFWLLLTAVMPLYLSAQDYASSRHFWEDGELTWDDFRGKPDNKGGRGYTDFGYASKWEKVRKGRTNYFYVKCITYVDRYDSWVSDSSRTDECLLYNQTLFDLSELYCRKATKEFNSEGFEGDIENVLLFYLKQMDRRVNELDEKSDTGKIALAVEEYYNYVQQELEREVAFDPLTVADRALRKSGYGMYFGYSLRAPIRGEFSPTHGITLGWDFPVRRSTVGFSINLEGFGRSNVYVETKDGPINFDEKVRSGSLDAYYGYNILRNASLSLFPFVGCALNFYDGDFYTNASGQRDSNEISCFALEAGINADVILGSQIRLFSGGRISNDFYSLRFRPYVSLANMKQGIGWMPSVNLSVSINLTGQ